MKIAILLTCFNRKSKTLECLSKLAEMSHPMLSLSIYLVDDGSTDGTSDAILESYPFVNIIEGTGDLYWNRGMHLAWSKARASTTYDYYLWLNDDTVLYPSALTDLMEIAEDFGGKVLVCGAVQSKKDGRFTYGGRMLNGRPIIPNGSLQRCEFVNGNCVLVSAEITDAVGILDPIFPHAIGDHDYGLRVLKNGYSVYSSKHYVGTCELNTSLPKWCYGSTPIIERVKSLYSPLGNCHPKYFFIFEKRHLGIVVAIKHYISIHLRMLLPSLWQRLKIRVKNNE